MPKRHCSGGSWAYQRVVTGDLATRNVLRPVIHFSKPSDGHYPAKETLSQDHVDSSSQPVQEQRQFYMSRTPFVPGPESPVQANKKRRYSAAIFIERDTKKQGTAPMQGEAAHHTVSTVRGAPPGAQAAQPPTGSEEMDIDSEPAANEPRALKRPGRSTRAKQPVGEKGPTPPATGVPAPLPQLHGDMDRVTAEMSAWTVNEIQRNLDGLEQQERAPVRPGSRDALKFQPRVPARRYVERHPQQQGVAKTNAPGGDGMALHAHKDDNADWIEVVYQRVPASKLDGTIPRGDIGLIVFEDDEEKEYFYEAADGDSDDAFEDEDDENGMFATNPPRPCFLGIPPCLPLLRRGNV